METTINLRRLFDFSQLPIVITGALLAALTVAIILMFLYSILSKYKKKEKKVEEKPVFVKPDMVKLKAQYLASLDAIEKEFNNDTTRIRPAYEKMSIVVREFVYKATGTEVDKFTLSEISQTEFEGLTHLVGEYYQPEFDEISEGDVRASLERSRRLVSEWN